MELTDVSTKKFQKRAKGPVSPFKKLASEYYGSKAVHIVMDIDGGVREGLWMISLVNGALTPRGKKKVRLELAAESFDYVTSVIMAAEFGCKIVKPAIFREYVAAAGKKLVHAAG